MLLISLLRPGLRQPCSSIVDGSSEEENGRLVVYTIQKGWTQSVQLYEMNSQLLGLTNSYLG